MNPLLRDRPVAERDRSDGSPNKTFRVAVVGARGAAGAAVLKVLEDLNFPVSELGVFASPRSEGKPAEFAGEKLPCKVLSDQAIEGFDIAIGAAGSTVTKEWADKFVEAGAVYIDKSSAWREDPKVPLVVPEVNPEALDEHDGRIASPNCSTTQMVVVLKPLSDAANGIERLVISTYQAVSGTGKKAIEELEEQSKQAPDDLRGLGGVAYPHQIAFNVLPQAGKFPPRDDHSDEERKLMNETRRILADDSIRISATCARVPVVTGHSEAVNVETKEPLEPERARALLEAAPGVEVVDDPGAARYPIATEAKGRDEVFVGRIRRDPGNERALDLWIVSDNLRKGAATNAVQIAELLVKRDLLGKR